MLKSESVFIVFLSDDGWSDVDVGTRIAIVAPGEIAIASSITHLDMLDSAKLLCDNVKSFGLHALRDICDEIFGWDNELDADDESETSSMNRQDIDFAIIVATLGLVACDDNKGKRNDDMSTPREGGVIARGAMLLIVVFDNE